MPDAPDRAELEAAIYRHLSLQPARETIEAVIVKVAELEPVTWPPDSKQLRAGLFLSVPLLGGWNQSITTVIGERHDEYREAVPPVVPEAEPEAA